MKTELLNHLSKSDLAGLLTLSHRSLACADHQDLKRLILDLKQSFYFENAVCAHGNVLEILQTEKQEPDIAVFDISYPDGYIDLYLENRYYRTDAVFYEFITNLSPVNWLGVDKKCSFNYPASVMACDFNMNNGWTHGTLDPETMNCSVFFFGGPVVDNHVRSAKILEYIIPFYSEAYKRVLKKSNKPALNLTKREIEVLHWAKEGKSSWEISMILRCSKRTVDFHINNLKNKLNAFSRAQAVAIGLQYGIIDF
jgi:DNA-binding CsgD family transcriptional regulator